MVFRGDVLSVDEMLQRALAEPAPVPRSQVGVLHTAASNAADCRDLLDGESGLNEAWRFGVLQTLDDYASTLRRGGPQVAAGVFADEPAPTGAAEVDAAFAALAEHLATRDGWEAPAWVHGPGRFLDTPWYPAVPDIFRTEADRDSPAAFRRRGIFLTSRSLARA